MKYDSLVFFLFAFFFSICWASHARIHIQSFVGRHWIVYFCLLLSSFFLHNGCSYTVRSSVLCDSWFHHKISSWKYRIENYDKNETEERNKKMCAKSAISEFQLLIAVAIYLILIYGHIFLFRWTDRSSKIYCSLSNASCSTLFY